jgi:hypothetical protein
MPLEASGAAGGGAVQAHATGASKEVQALLVEWRLESAAAVFAKLGLERVIDLEYVNAVQIERMSISDIAKNKALALLKWFRDTQKAAEPAQKKVKRKDRSGEAGGGGGPSERRDPPLLKGGEGGAAATGEARNADNPNDPRSQAVAPSGGVAQEAAGAAGGEAGRLNIRVEYLGDTRNLVNPQRRLYSASTIAVVKSVIQDVTGLSPSSQRLRFAEEDLDDVRTLAFYGVVDGSVLQLFLWGSDVKTPGCMWLQVRDMGGPGKRDQITCSPSETIATIKSRIGEKLPPGIPTDQQRLLFFGVQMADARTLESYGVALTSMVVHF